MAQNLNYETASGSYCYGDDSENCDTYGRLYTWSAAMNGANSSNSIPSGVQGVCPDAWHLPSDDEWEIMANYIANDAGLTGKANDDWTEIGQKLKSATEWVSYAGTTSDDAYGFSGLPGGYRSSAGFYYDEPYFGSWWMPTEYSSTYASIRYLSYYNDFFDRSYNRKASARSIRCVMN